MDQWGTGCGHARCGPVAQAADQAPTVSTGCGAQKLTRRNRRPGAATVQSWPVRLPTTGPRPPSRYGGVRGAGAPCRPTGTATVTVVLIPARFSKAEERRWVAEMLARLQARDQRRAARAAAQRRGAARPRRGSWRPPCWTAGPAGERPLGVQHGRPLGFLHARRRHASGCPSGCGRCPGWVLDYVLVHELAHLLVPGHGADFWELSGATRGRSGPGATWRASRRLPSWRSGARTHRRTPRSIPAPRPET